MWTGNVPKGLHAPMSCARGKRLAVVSGCCKCIPYVVSGLYEYSEGRLGAQRDVGVWGHDTPPQDCPRDGPAGWSQCGGYTSKCKPGIHTAMYNLGSAPWVRPCLPAQWQGERAEGALKAPGGGRGLSSVARCPSPPWRAAPLLRGALPLSSVVRCPSPPWRAAPLLRGALPLSSVARCPPLTSAY